MKPSVMRLLSILFALAPFGAAFIRARQSGDLRMLWMAVVAVATTAVSVAAVRTTGRVNLAPASRSALPRFLTAAARNCRHNQRLIYIRSVRLQADERLATASRYVALRRTRE